MSAFIDFAQPLHAQAGRLRHRFGVPREVLVAHALHEVRGVLQAVHAHAQSGRWCVGYVRYEAAPAFDAALQTHVADGPYAWFTVHDAPLPDDTLAPVVARGAEAAQVQWTGSLARADFDAKLSQIQEAIRAGELYQVNFTAPLHGVLQGEGHALFAALQRVQPEGYAAHFTAQQEQVLSVSPELFFDWQDAPDGGTILARPMKGTAPRGATEQADADNAQHLRTDPKERAENVMIVDLLRNDLSRIAQAHTVRVPALFATQALPTVWQMTSDVRARTRVGVTLHDVFAALFPCGSVTGAPKVRAMQMIRQLEPQARGIYCGAVGVVRPHGQPQADGRYAVAATFNVPIRTVVLRQDAQGTVHASCGIGSGITADAQANNEWNEWRHKRAFVQRASTTFELLETLALHDGTLRHAALHLERMQAVAQHFGYPWNADHVQHGLQALVAQHAQGLWRVRLLLNAQGQLQAQAFALQATPSPVGLQLATTPMAEAHSEFTRFKTTHRPHYDAFTPEAADVFDTVLYNEAGELTECTRGNIAALLDGRWVTPPLACGLLPGVGRAVALREGRVVEGRVHLNDVPRVQDWAFMNSLRGWLPATFRRTLAGNVTKNLG
jgi:para-aminobenzoate synthetase / 4-amino-4-deoxychorismate lyase